MQHTHAHKHTHTACTLLPGHISDTIKWPPGFCWPVLVRTHSFSSYRAHLALWEMVWPLRVCVCGMVPFIHLNAMATPLAPSLFGVQKNHSFIPCVWFGFYGRILLPAIAWEILVPTTRVLPALINFAFVVLAPWRYIPHIGRWPPVPLNGFGFIINFPNDEIDDVQLKPGNNNRGPAPGSVAPFRTFLFFFFFPCSMVLIPHPLINLIALRWVCNVWHAHSMGPDPLW